MQQVEITPARRLAVEWVWKLEFGVFRSKDTGATHILARYQQLTSENKNPMAWTEKECEEFLSKLLKTKTP